MFKFLYNRCNFHVKISTRKISAENTDPCFGGTENLYESVEVGFSSSDGFVTISYEKGCFQIILILQACE
jgi:hypothetical protein